MSPREWLMEGLRVARSEWQEGRDDGIPVCSRTRYCWDILLNDYPAMKRPAHKGLVPCGVFHRLSHLERYQWATYWLEAAERDPEIAEISRSK